MATFNLCYTKIFQISYNIKHFTEIGIQIIVNNYLYTETVTSKTLTVSVIWRANNGRGMKTNLKGQKILIMLLLFYYRWQHKKTEKTFAKTIAKRKEL